MKILFLTSRLPFPPVGGDKIRTFNFIKYLKKRHQLTLISFIEDAKELECLSEYTHYYHKLITVKLTRLKSYRNCLTGLLRKKPLQVHYYFSEEMKEKVAQELGNGYSAIYCHLIRMAQYLPNNNGINKVVDLTDAMSLNYHRSKQFRKGFFSIINYIEAHRMRKYELATISKADSALFISNFDGGVLSDQKNRNKIKVVSNGVELDYFSFSQNGYDDNQLLFVGNMRTFPNTDAVLYFAKNIFPLLRESRPELRFYIVGSEPNKKVRKLHNGKNIIVTGFVDSVTPYIRNSVVTVAPMRVGAGIQNKILESMAVGTPVVTTPIGAEGLDNRNLSVAETATEFYLEVLNLVENKKLREKKAIAGRKYIEENFAWPKQLHALEECLQ